MRKDFQRWVVLLYTASLVACSSAPGITPAHPESTASEEIVVIGAASAQKATVAGQYSAVVTGDGSAGDREYSFAPDTAVYRNVSRNGTEMIEFHGKQDATFYPASRVRALTRLTSDGKQRSISLSSLAVRTRASDGCLLIPQAAVRSPRSISCGDDPGPCPDCSGPMAPGGQLACHYVRCGGDPDIGTGFGIGIFRSPDPQLTCYFNFTDGTYQCDFDVYNTSSTPPEDLSNGYGYNAAMGAQLLHCKGPAKTSEAFVVGKNPDSGIGVNLGFHKVVAGRAVAHSMFTRWTYNTTMNAQYFSLSVSSDPVEYVGYCSGAN